jgi:hypothetical protein
MFQTGFPTPTNFPDFSLLPSYFSRTGNDLGIYLKTNFRCAVGPVCRRLYHRASHCDWFSGRWCPYDFAACIRATGLIARLSKADNTVACAPPRPRPAPSAPWPRSHPLSSVRRTLPTGECSRAIARSYCVMCPSSSALAVAPSVPSQSRASFTAHQASSPCATLLRPRESCLEGGGGK